MNAFANVLILLVAVLHLWFLVMEMVLWTKPLGRKTFRMSPEKAETTRVLAANQGLYNGFLAAGLLWSALLLKDWRVTAFFLGCVVVAGIFGAVTVSRPILWIQALPAALALGCLFAGLAQAF